MRGHPGRARRDRARPHDGLPDLPRRGTTAAHRAGAGAVRRLLRPPAPGRGTGGLAAARQGAGHRGGGLPAAGVLRAVLAVLRPAELQERAARRQRGQQPARPHRLLRAVPRGRGGPGERAVAEPDRAERLLRLAAGTARARHRRTAVGQDAGQGARDHGGRGGAAVPRVQGPRPAHRHRPARTVEAARAPAAVRVGDRGARGDGVRARARHAPRAGAGAPGTGTGARDPRPRPHRRPARRPHGRRPRPAADRPGAAEDGTPGEGAGLRRGRHLQEVRRPRPEPGAGASARSRLRREHCTGRPPPTSASHCPAATSTAPGDRTASASTAPSRAPRPTSSTTSATAAPPRTWRSRAGGGRHGRTSRTGRRARSCWPPRPTTRHCARPWRT